jgi:redox-sensitive bicupin YhaK (pirin superfamily)
MGISRRGGPLLTIRRSDERGRTRTNWLESRHTFSFGEYHDPSFINFGALRVINEDRIAGGGGFRPHSHTDMEIVTYLLEGELEHRDSTGAGGVVRPGEIQRMSAGKGITHTEVNSSREQICHLLQIWIAPSSEGSDPSYEQRAIEREAMQNRFARIAAPEPLACEVRLLQDAEIWASLLAADNEAIHPIAPGRRAWLQVARGHVVLNDTSLQSGDGAAVTDEDGVTVRAREPSELLLFDLA